MGRPAARADPQSFDRFAVVYDRYAGLEPPMVLDWLLAQLPSAVGAPWTPGAGRAVTPLTLADRFDEIVGVDVSQPLVDLARHQRPHPRIRYQRGAPRF
jgi:hypothetical protein